MRGFRIGHGYDLHRVVEGRALMLGGVHLESSWGLLGHSDGDVVLHAICDAVLGAMGVGDMGQHFPDSDERFRGVASSVLARHVTALLRVERWTVGNIDVTVHAERPRLAPHRHAIRSRVADLFGVDVTAVSVKAKTNEGVDAVGRGEAVAASAVVLLTDAGAPG